MAAETVKVEISDEDRERLAAVLGSSERANDVIPLVLKAGAKESLSYATGAAVFSSMADLRMFRVFCLIDAGLKAKNSEDVVAALFKIPAATARRLIENAFARYSIELRATVVTEVGSKLNEATPIANKKWRLVLPAGFVRDAVLTTCSASDKPNPTNPKGSVYEFSDETFALARQAFGLGAVKWKKP